MVTQPQMTAKEIYAVLRCCPYMRIVGKIFKGWIFKDSLCTGFWAKVNSNLGKEVKIEKIKKYCENANLPVEIINDESHLTRIKIAITNRSS